MQNKTINSEAWNTFIKEVFPDSKDREFVQRLYGYALLRFNFSKDFLLSCGNEPQKSLRV